MIVVSILLILVGIAALVLAAIFPVIGIGGIIGGVVAILAGIGLYVFYCNCCRTTQ
jgi:hypothetical protein